MKMAEVSLVMIVLIVLKLGDYVLTQDAPD